MPRSIARDLVVRALSRRSTTGIATIGTLRLRCALGRSGSRMATLKREGDGATPAGRFGARRVLFRADRLARPQTRLAIRPLRPDDGWCELPDARTYNSPVRTSDAAATDHMWRADRLYDIVIVIGHNDAPRVRDRGSAVFVHVARDGYRPTAGCIAFSRRDIVLLLARLSRRSRVIVM